MEWLEGLERLFKDAVRDVCEERTGVIFSSGVDSALVAYTASEYSDVTAYTVGLEGSKDLEYARRVEEKAPFRIEYVELSVECVESLIPEILRVWSRPNPLDVGVGIPFYAASRAASEDGLKLMLCGQGGDELFGGYWRYLESMVSEGKEAVIAWMDRDCESADSDNLDRDRSMCRANGVELRMPFLNEDFSGYVRKMALDLKIREDAEDMVCDEIDGRKFARKYALKKLGLKTGVPDYIVNRLKKAAQYGSGTQKTLDKIARRNGYKQKAAGEGRKDYLQMYLEDVFKSI
ncbi:MAG: hypothetical protein GF416_01930 [Candidatus Altiarchaeales archaeon]|nr:hypothetical protein [Candidatus Altiarchaeales archaeon]MBD3415876.1 hypothetical protein [Candidatus Altiarchaeales archaeon]